MTTRKGVTPLARAVAVAVGASISLPVLALGLGDIEMKSFLNEPLSAEVELLDTRELTTDDIRIRLAGGDDFNRLGVQRSFFLTSIQFDVVIDEASGRGRIRLSTQEAVLEPYLDLIIEARWPSGRLLREYTVLVDPPAFRQEVVTVSASERVEAANPSKPAVAEESQERASESTSEVKLRESSLAPGQMPDRAFSAATAADPVAGNRYMVRRDETLWQIASQGRPDGISVQQAMLDIQRLNPEAFINGNINQIKAGYIIYLPAAGEVSSDDLADALDEVREQNQEWQSGRSAPGVTAAATLRVSAEPGAEDSAGQLDELTAVDAGGAAATEADAGAGTRSASGSSTDSMDDAAADAQEQAEQAGAIANAELAAQMNAMTERLDTLEQIVALKDEQIATLEQALREAREQAAAAAAAQPVAVQPAAPQSPAPVQPTGNNADSSGGIPWLPVGGGLLALLLGFLFFWRRRSNDNAEKESEAASDSLDQDVFAGVSLNKDALDEAPAQVEQDVEAAVPASDKIDSDEAVTELDEEFPPIVADSVTDEELDALPGLDVGGSRGYGERKNDDYIDEGASGDALAEADIYIAYGRYLQAIELLDTAIKDEPKNSAYRLKLLELYVDMGEGDSAQAQLEELRHYGDDAALAKGEDLLGGGAGEASNSFDLDASDALELEPAPAAQDSDDLELELALDDEPVADADDLGNADAATQDEPLVFDLSDDHSNDAADDEDIGDVEFDNLEIEDDDAIDGADGELDFASSEEELDLSDALVDGAPADSPVSPTEDSGEDLLIAEDADQMATKLDLARAYMDMGDSEGAKSILEEVASKGTEEQQSEASDLLSRIG